MTWLRSAAFNLWFYGVTLVVAVLSIPAPLFPEALTRWISRVWSRLVLGGLGPICGIRVEITGQEHLPRQGPALIASQHQSAFDTIIWLLLVPRAAYVLKQELTRIPVYGALCRRMGMIAVDRGAGASAIRSLLKGADRAIAEMRQIVIFPEGTRAPPGTVLPLHPGIAALANRTGLPVVPVATDSGRCWGRRAFRKHPGVIRVAIRPPLPAGLSRAALLAQLSAIYAQDPAEPVDNSVGGGVTHLRESPRTFP
jgi:1-acyl-sn-glycerol-3-phosphate acyltransferase